MSQSDTHQTLEVGAGESVVNGKTHWTDFIVVRVADREKAFDIAMEILRQYQYGRFRETSAITFYLTGVLEESLDD